MAAILLTEESLATLKKALLKHRPEVRSSHLTEALAASLRRRTHASLRSQLPQYRVDPPIELLAARGKSPAQHRWCLIALFSLCLYSRTGICYRQFRHRDRPEPRSRRAAVCYSLDAAHNRVRTDTRSILRNKLDTHPHRDVRRRDVSGIHTHGRTHVTNRIRSGPAQVRGTLAEYPCGT